MSKVASKDGTQIGYSKEGQGPAVISVDGAMGFRSFGFSPELSKLLSPYFTVYSYDRRGRGESGDTQPYSVECEIEDLEALIDQAGGSACLFGISSGACLAMEAAIKLGSKVKKLAMYEPPYNNGEGIPEAWRKYRRTLDELLAAGRRGDMPALCMEYVGTPSEMIEGMRQSPVWSTFESIAPTLRYDAACMGEDQSIPLEKARKVTVPTLVMNGTAGAPFMNDTAQALAKAMPHGQHRVLEGQRHDVSMEVLAPILIEFFKGK